MSVAFRGGSQERCQFLWTVCYLPPKMLFAEVLSRSTSKFQDVSLKCHSPDFIWLWYGFLETELHEDRNLFPCLKWCLACDRYSCHFLRQETGIRKISKWEPWWNCGTTWCVWTLQLQAQCSAWRNFWLLLEKILKEFFSQIIRWQDSRDG